MYVTSAKQRQGLLIAVITGGRPQLKQRPTHKLLPALKQAGFTNITWIVAEHHAPDYEQDEFPLTTYPTDWAHNYATTHWMHTDPPPDREGFFGAFPGREYACLEAERRGCWGVLQLDDNIVSLTLAKTVKASIEIVKNNGGAALFADLLAVITLSTNGRMVGAQLASIPQTTPLLARPGFPYSCFIEQVGEGREHWYGPFEDDITHAFQYGTRADGATALVSPTLLYQKEFTSKSGMRSKYNHTRAVQLQRIFPESAKINIRKAKSNGAGGPRVFHTMTAGAIRNPLTIKDKDLYSKTRTRMEQLVAEWSDLALKYNRQKVILRAIKQGLTPPDHLLQELETEDLNNYLQKQQ